MSDKVYIGRSAIDLNSSPTFGPISCIRLVVGDDQEYVAGNTTGRTIEIECPWGTQEMADDLLASLGGYSYQPLDVQTAFEADPLWELGDGVTVGGLYSQIVGMPSSFGLKFTADVNAPESGEINHEYPYESRESRTIERKIAKVRASLRVDIDKIVAQVTDDEGNYNVLTIGIDGTVFKGNGGEVTISGGSIDAKTINAQDLNLTGAIRWEDFSEDLRDRVDIGKGDENPSYIKSTYISRTNILSPSIWGGELWATGQGDSYGSNPAFYLSDGWNGSYSNPYATPKGWLCFDKHGAGTQEEAAERVFLHSESNVAMKLDCGGNMSLSAAGSIFVEAPLSLLGDMVGEYLPSGGVEGQVFFLRESGSGWQKATPYIYG